jgi:quercetin dioxygenase-like cupin family protein
MTVDYGTKGTKTYKAGDSFLEAINWPHNGVNSGAVPVRLIAVYMGAEGAANTVTTPAP